MLAVLFAALVLAISAADPATASEVEDAIEELEQELAAEGARCAPDPDGVAALLRAIDESTSEVEQIRGMRWLSGSPLWHANARKGDYWRMFLRFSEAENSFALRYYTGLAMIMQRGELIRALLDEDRGRVDSLLELNLDTNSVYADLARLAAAQFVLWDSSAELASQPSGVANDLSGVDESLREVFASDDARNFLRPTSIVQEIALARAILSQLSEGDDIDAWRLLYEEHAADAQTAFDPALGVAQPNSRFLNPGRIVADIVFGPQSRLCAETEQRLLQTNNRFFALARANRGGILNPIYAIEHACRGVLESQSVIALAESMAIVENRDYRVVVGHTRDDAVRFSDLDPEELEIEISEHMATYQPSERDTPQDTATVCRVGADPSFFERGYDVERFRSIESDDGYIYVGQGLTRDEAMQLVEFIVSERAFRGAYVFRPVDRR